MRASPALLALALAACTHRAPTVTTAPDPHYVVGAAYQLGGLWSYPQEQFQYDATGLAERLPDGMGLTADGERVDPTAMAGAHRTLQLPAIVDVTNLDNGRQIRIRLDERGPVMPGRVLGLTRRAADLLGLSPTTPAPVRLELDSVASQALRDQLGGGPRGMTAAPVASVSQETLGPPGQTRPTRTVIAPAIETPSLTGSRTLDRLPETVRIVPVQPSQLWVHVGEFTQPRYAEALRRKLGALPVQIRRDGAARRPNYVIMAGPFASVATADAGLDRIRAAGVTDASIVVE